MHSRRVYKRAQTTKPQPIVKNLKNSTMPGFKSFAVAGAGNLGQHVVKALLHLKKVGTITSVKVLTRSVSHSLSNLRRVTNFVSQGWKEN